MRERAGKRQDTCLRNGDPWLKAMLVPSAWPAIAVKDSTLRARFRRLKARRGVKKTMVATVADLLRSATFIFIRNTLYRDLGATFFDLLNTAQATANVVHMVRALGYDVHITPAS